MPYLLSTLDTLAWRYNVPEMVYPEGADPGMREIGGRDAQPLGTIYPRGGFLQTDDYRRASSRSAGRCRHAAHAAARHQPLLYEFERRLLNRPAP